MLIDVIIKRLRSGADGKPFTLAGNRVFGALTVADVVTKFNADLPALVVAPVSEAAPVPKLDQPIHETEITRIFQVVGIFSAGQDDVARQNVASDAELLRDQLLVAFNDWIPACAIAGGYYTGMSVLGDFNGRAAVAFSFAFLEIADHDKMRSIVYDAEKSEVTGKTIGMSLSGRRIVFRPGRPGDCSED